MEVPKVEKYKTKLCNNFKMNGICKYGNHCVFAHGEKEMKRDFKHDWLVSLCYLFIYSHLSGIKSAQKGLNPSRPPLPKRSMHPYLHTLATNRSVNRMQSHQLKMLQRPIKRYSSTKEVNSWVLVSEYTRIIRVNRHWNTQTQQNRSSWESEIASSWTASNHIWNRTQFKTNFRALRQNFNVLNYV